MSVPAAVPGVPFRPIADSSPPDPLEGVKKSVVDPGLAPAPLRPGQKIEAGRGKPRPYNQSSHSFLGITGYENFFPQPARAASSSDSRLRFEISFPASASSGPLDGRLLLIISKNGGTEPRFTVSSDSAYSQQLFGIDINGLAPGQTAVIGASVLGYPLDGLTDLPAGDYNVQAVLNIYETFHRGDGFTLKLPMDHGEGQRWNSKPGNLYSKPRWMHLDPKSTGAVRVHLTEVIPPIQPPADTDYVKHLRITSRLLSEFWGRPMELGAIVLLPAGWSNHPSAHYPLVVYQGHFSYDFDTGVSFRPEEPAPGLTGDARTQAEYDYKFYQDWVSGRLPRVIILLIQHANPYYDDSYAVDSSNLGPYGSAITQELIPEVERRFRGIGQGWARTLYGGSTGGWEALADQVFYPDYFNGAWVFCPDPVDFHAFQLVDVYDDKSAFWLDAPFARVPRPFSRKADGTILSTADSATQYEFVLGTHGRSTEQLDIWQAVFGPVGPDGYPAPIWDPRTGVIDHQVADYWRDHYDLDAIIQRDWRTLGPKLAGKLHFTVGDMDTYYLNLAVRRLQDFLDTPQNPYRISDFVYGRDMPHCYTGDPSVPMSVSGRTVNQRYLPAMAEWMTKTAPEGADVKSWKY